MLKLNTLLTGLAVVLMALLGFLGKAIWYDVATIKTATTAVTTKMDAMSHTLDDHETRIRQTEHDVIVLQQERPLYHSPKAGGNNNNPN